MPDDEHAAAATALVRFEPIVEFSLNLRLKRRANLWKGTADSILRPEILKILLPHGDRFGVARAH